MRLSPQLTIVLVLFITGCGDVIRGQEDSGQATDSSVPDKSKAKTGKRNDRDFLNFAKY